MPLPEPVRRSVERRLSEFCRDRIPAEHRAEIRLEYELRGNSITLFECRPPWRPDFGPEWTRMKIAQLRFEPNGKTWALHWADRNERWHLYDDVDPALSVEPLLAEIDEDPTGIFWG